MSVKVPTWRVRYLPHSRGLLRGRARTPSHSGDFPMKLSQLAAGLILGFGIASAALAQTTMKISISTSQNSHQGVAIDTFAKEVAARTNGRYKVETFYNGS